MTEVAHPQGTDWLEAFQSAIASLRPETVTALGLLYHPEADFSDPFQAIRGRPAIEAAYTAMFTNLHAARFEDLRLANVGPTEVVARWEFVFHWKADRPETRIAGTSWLTLCPETRLILRHEDHWDASALFAAVPAVGWAVRALKRQVAKAAHVTQSS